VNSLRKPLAYTLWFWAVLVALPAPAANLPPVALRDLAAHASLRQTWPQLRSYAHLQKNHEWSGWAYFVLGYQEYEAQQYPEAAPDLAKAAQSHFSLADYALFYQASALRQSGRVQDAALTLQDFTARFPHSSLRSQVLGLRAGALLNAQQAQAALDLLAPDPETPKQPALALLLAQVDAQLQRLAPATASFQNVYYNFALSAQAHAAADGILALRKQMGAAYPEPDVELKMTRAQALFKAGRYPDALSEYSDLLKAVPVSPVTPRALMGQARCLLHLGRGADAVPVLSAHFDSAELEAQRLALLVQVHAQQSDAVAITQDLAQIEASSAAYPAYADALSSAGIFYYRQLNWQEAARYYRRLAELFPQNDHLREDGWRLAWCDYLLADAHAADVIRGYLTKFPDSPRAPAALYWLGRIQEDQGATTEAGALYALLASRFVHTYHAPLAKARLAAIRARQGGVAGVGDAAGAPLTAALIAVLTPPTIPRHLACPEATPSDAARPALILQKLGLPAVEQDVLKAAMAGQNPPTELRLLLTETYAAQDNTAAALLAALKIAPAYAQMQFSDLPQQVWGFLYPQAYWKLVRSQARLNKLDPYLVMGLIRQESAFSARALSVANARGLMQVLPQTAAHSSRASRIRTASRRLYDPNYNVRVGCAYLAKLLKDFDGKPELAVAAYNAGDFRVNDWEKKYSFRDSEMFLESIPIPATRTYVELVLRDAEIYRQLLTGSPHFAKCSPTLPTVTPGGPGTTLQGGASAAQRGAERARELR
jgi:soluble lytic murein transglycosylase